MSTSDKTDGAFKDSEVGLDDRSEELSERTEEDAQIRFYRAMADTEADYGRLLANLSRAVAEVIFDFCVVYLIDEQQDKLQAATAYHPHRQTLQSIHRAFAPGGGGICDKLVERVLSRRENYFRPRWRPSLLKAYYDDGEAPQLDIAIHSLMVVPMITTDGECLGALLVGRHTTTASYDETDLALTEWIASHASMKLENARLYRDLRRANKQLDAAVQIRNTFISIASHELRTPLSTLKLQAGILRRTTQKNPEKVTQDTLLSKLDSIDQQVDHLDRLLDQLLNVSRIIDGGLTVNYESCHLERIIEEVAERFHGEIEATETPVKLDFDDAVIGVWDRERLDHVAANLLSNAIKYGDGNPVIVRTENHGDEAMLQVVDHGHGIAPEAYELIFERFERGVHTRGKKGLGLGLWIVREYVESLHGTIEVDSTVGEGSTFTVRLPVEPPPAG